MERHLVRTEYQVEQNKPVLYVFCRENNKRILHKVSDFVPYFYVLESEKDNLKGIRQDSQSYQGLDGSKLVKVYTTLPSDVLELREKYSRTWEGDILFPTRYMIDEVVSLDPIMPKVMFIDIETNNSGRVPDITLAQEEVICVTCYCDNVYTTFVFRHDLSPGVHHEEFDDSLSEIQYFRNEGELLKALLQYVRREDPDVLVGWNSNRFDLPYLINRMKRLGINYQQLSPMESVYLREDEILKGQGVIIKGIAVMDMYDIYRRMTVQQHGQEESYTLDYIGQKVVGRGKTESQNNVRWMWEHNLDRLIEYNRNDSSLVFRIDEKMRLLDFLEELRRLCYCNLEDCLTASRMIDSYILRIFHNRIIFPTKIKHEQQEYEGAYINTWATGIYKNVVVFDIRSLYPSTMYSLNLSPETVSNKFLPNSAHIDKIHVRKEPKGVLPEVVETLFKERIKYKELSKTVEFDSPQYRVYDNRQYALKTLLNALYGQTAYTNSRYYDIRIAETVTWIGRKIINWSKDFLENIGYKVLYVDTDSAHWVLDSELDIEQIIAVQNLLNDSYNEFATEFGIDNHIFNIEFEKVYKRAFYGKAKKRYAGAVCYKDGKNIDKLETWGLETRRSDASQFTRKLLETVLDMLLRQDKTKDEVLKYIGEQIDRIRKGNYRFTEIGIPKGISKELSEYQHPAANVRGAIFSTKELGHDLSTKPKLIYISKLPQDLPATYQFTSQGKEKKVDVICFDEDNQVPPGTEIDIEKMLEKLVKDKLEPIFEALNWKMSELGWYWRGKAPKQGTQESLFDISEYQKIIQK